MQLYSFTMRQGTQVVASGEASAVMVYEFQKKFVETIGYGAEHGEGKFATLDNLLSRKVGENEYWSCLSVDGKVFTFSCIRRA